MRRINDSNPSPIAVCSDSFFFEKDKSENILVMGVGNYLMGDEGIGVHIIQEMAKQDLPDHVDILDGGTGGFSLLGCVIDLNSCIASSYFPRSKRSLPFLYF